MRKGENDIIKKLLFEDFNLFSGVETFSNFILHER